jgi:hypothetical protein
LVYFLLQLLLASRPLGIRHAVLAAVRLVREVLAERADPVKAQTDQSSRGLGSQEVSLRILQQRSHPLRLLLQAHDVQAPGRDFQDLDQVQDLRNLLAHSGIPSLFLNTSVYFLKRFINN